MAAAKKAAPKKAVAKTAPKKAANKPAAKKPAAKKSAPAKKAPAKKPSAPAKAQKAIKAAKAVKPSKAVRHAAPVKAEKPAGPAKDAKAAKVAAKSVAGTRPATPAARATATAARATKPARATERVASTAATMTTPEPTPVQAKTAPAPTPKDLAAAHEYLLARTATRSEEPVLVNGKKLPTEGELLKMPEAAYMNDQQLAFFKYRLQQMESELLQNADETTEHLRETVIVPDPADRATIEEEHALELRTRDRERKLLKKVQQALARIETGDYGYCEETGDPIGVPRLLARPTATLSLEAQQRREIKQKMYGD